MADTSPSVPTDRWMKAGPLQQVSSCTLGVKTAPAWLTASVSYCHREPKHPAGGPIAAWPPASLHPCFSSPPSPLHPGVQQACSPSFHVFASVSPSSSGKSPQNPPPKCAFFPAPTLPSSLRTYLLHICIARLISSMFPTRCKSKGTEPSLSLGLHSPASLPPTPEPTLFSPPPCSPGTERNHCPWQSIIPVLMEPTCLGVPSKSGYHSPAAPEFGAG